MPIDNEGDPTNITLRFKYGYITILLFSEPVTPFSSLQRELLSVLQERYPKGLPKPNVPGSRSYIPLPSSATHIILGMPKDHNDPTLGWDKIELGGRGAGLKDCPKGLGIKDGGVLAFRFRAEDEDEDEDGDEDLDEAENEAANGFVVEWPVYEEQYAEHTEQSHGKDEDDEMDDGGDEENDEGEMDDGGDEENDEGETVDGGDEENDDSDGDEYVKV